MDFQSIALPTELSHHISKKEFKEIFLTRGCKNKGFLLNEQSNTLFILKHNNETYSINVANFTIYDKLYQLSQPMSHLLQQQLEKITSVTKEEFEYISSHFSKKKLKKHQFLLQENEEVLNDYFVTKGLLKAYHTNDDGKEHILQFAMEDWWITDYAAYFNETKSTISINCIEDCEVLCLSLHNREKLCAEMHKMEHFFRKKSNAGYVALQKRILSLLNNNAKERYDALLTQQPTLFQRLPKILIASYLGVSRETLSRMGV